MDSSDGEGVDAFLPPPKRQKRHRFKKMAERIEAIDVDVYRSLQAVRSDPVGGAASFFQERVTYWHELNSSAEYARVMRLLHPMIGSLPQLLHNREKVLDSLLQALRPDAILALEPIADLIGTLARDLQGDFMPLFPKVAKAMYDFVDDGIRHEPEALEHMFTGLSLIFKSLAPLFAQKPLWLLSQTSRLRYHQTEHVRKLAAQAVAYIVRQTKQSKLQAVVKSVVSDCCTRKRSEATLDGAGRLIAEACIGVQNRLNSRAAELLRPVLQLALLSPGEFRKGSKRSCDGKENGRGSAGCSPSEDGGQHSWLNADFLEARSSEVCQRAIERILVQVGDGPSGQLWACVLEEAKSRLDTWKAVHMGHSNGSSPDGVSSVARQTHSRNLARCVSCVAAMVEHKSGRLVEDLGSIFQLLDTLAGSPADALSPLCSKRWRDGQGDLGDVEGLNIAGKADGSGLQEDGSLIKAVVRLTLATVISHMGKGKVENIAPRAQLWGTPLLEAPVEVVSAFAQGLDGQPATREAMALFAPQLVAALGRVLVSQKGTLDEEGEKALLALAQVCGCQQSALEPGPSQATLARDDCNLEDWICGFILSWPLRTVEGMSSTDTSKAAMAAAWLVLECAPALVGKTGKLVDFGRHFITSLEKIRKSLSQMGCAGYEGHELCEMGCMPWRVRQAELVDVSFLQSRAFSMLATLSSHEPASLLGIARECLGRWVDQPKDYHALKVAGGVLALMNARGHREQWGRHEDSKFLSTAHLAKIMPLLDPLVADSSLSVRSAALTLLCCFEQPSWKVAVKSSQESQAVNARCNVLDAFREMHVEQLSLQNGRKWACALEGVASWIEFKQLPESLLKLVVSCLVGVMYLRFQPLWQPAASALTISLKLSPEVAWPVVLAQASRAQGALLSGGSQTVPVGSLLAPTAKALPATMQECYEMALNAGSAAAAGGCTDPLTRLVQFLSSLQGAHQDTWVCHTSEWIPLFLQYLEAKPPTDKTAGSNRSGSGGHTARLLGREWRTGILAWLSAVSTMHGAKHMPSLPEVVRPVAALLDEADSTVQEGAINCLVALNVRHLSQYTERLTRLTQQAAMRREMLVFPLSLDSSEAVPVAHRPGLIPIITHILFPKLKKPGAKLGNKNSSAIARPVILNYLAGAPPQELSTLVGLCLAPLGSAFKSPEGQGTLSRPGDHASIGGKAHDEDVFSLEKQTIFTNPWWATAPWERSSQSWLEAIDAQSLASVPFNQKKGVLTLFEDAVAHLGHKLEPFLPLLMALLSQMLAEACQPIKQANNSPHVPEVKMKGEALGTLATAAEGRVGAEGQSGRGEVVADINEEVDEDGGRRVEGASLAWKQIRRLCLKLLAVLWTEFPDFADQGLFVECFLHTVEPMVGRLSVECSSQQPLRLLLCVKALCSHPILIRSLNHQGQHSDGGSQSLNTGPVGGSLLSNVLRILSSPRCSAVSRDVILDIVDSIFELGPDIVRDVLEAHVPVLLRSLKDAISNKQAGRAVGLQQTGKMKTRQTADRELVTLERLAKFASDTGLAMDLVDALVPLLQAKRRVKGRKLVKDEHTIARVLRCLTAAWWSILNLPKQEAGKILEADLWRYFDTMASLARSLTSRDARCALCSAYSALASLLPDAKAIADLLNDLNSYSETTLDELDYDRRAAASAQLTVELWQSMTFAQSLPLVSSCIFDLQNAEDISVRHAALQALSRLITASIGTSKGQDHLLLVRHILGTYPAGFPAALTLTDTDPELDFFHNVAHLQLHRRARAWARLSKVLQEGDGQGPLNVESLCRVVRPLLLQAIFEGLAKEDNPHRMREADISREANIVEAAVRTLSLLSSRFGWHEYRSLLVDMLGMIRKMRSNPTRGAVRALCTVVDAFHFKIDPTGHSKDYPEPEGGVLRQPGRGHTAVVAGSEELGDSGVVGKCPVVENTMEEGDSEAEGELDGSEDGDVFRQAKGVLPDKDQAHNLLLHRVLPALNSLLFQDEEHVREAVALSLVRLMRVLPPHIERDHLGGLLQKVANLLRARHQGIRDDARRVLVGMARELGARCTSSVLKVLVSALPDRGYTVHVLGHTLHAVLSAVAGTAEPGDIDDAVNIILPVVDAELFGEVAEAKDAVQFSSSYKEAKTCQAYKVFELVLQLSSLQSVVTAVGAVRLRLRDATRPKHRAKIVDLLGHGARGFLTNKCALPADIMTFIHATLTQSLEVEERGMAIAVGVSGLAGTPSGEDQIAADPAALYECLMIEFALKMLHAGLKTRRLDVHDAVTLGLLDPLLPILVRCLKSRHAACVVLGLKCLCQLASAPLPGLRNISEAMGLAVMHLVDAAPTTADPTCQGCFKLLARLIQSGDWFRPSHQHIKSLLILIAADLEEHVQSTSAFALLKAIVAANIVAPTVYDAMKKVQEMMVQHHDSSVRSACNGLLLQFLLDYPMANLRLTQHVRFMLSNLGYEYEAGRLEVLSLLNAVVRKFPQEVLEAQAELFFLPLVTRLVNESSPACRSSVGDVVRKLLVRLDGRCRDKLTNLTLQWLHGEDSRLRTVGSQTLGLIAEVSGEQFSRYEAKALDGISAVLAAHVLVSDCNKDELENDSECAPVEGWQEAYHSLLLVEKLVAILGPSSLLICTIDGTENGHKRPASKVWMCAVHLLRYPHSWVRKAAARLVGVGLAAQGVGVGDTPEGHVGAGCGTTLGGLGVGELAFMLYLVLEADGVDKDLATQAVKCLVWISPELNKVTRRYSEQHGQGDGAVKVGDGCREGLETGGVNDAAGGQNGDGVTDHQREVDESKVGIPAASPSGIGDWSGNPGIDDDVDGAKADDYLMASSAESSMDSEAESEAQHLLGRNSDARPCGVLTTTETQDAASSGRRSRGLSTRKNELRKSMPIAGRGALTMLGLVHRMEKLAEDQKAEGQSRRLMSLKFLAALTSRLGAQEVTTYLPVMLRPVYRILEGSSGAMDKGEVRTVAEEVLGHIRDEVGGDALLEAYGKARQFVQEKSSRRRQRAKMQALTDPQAASVRKLQKNKRKMESRKRKEHLNRTMGIRKKTVQKSGGTGKNRHVVGGNRGRR
eukprot:evm.model.scf_622.2 EVM.evm.TU.scf_622.2   scf_622:22710-43215(-)